MAKCLAVALLLSAVSLVAQTTLKGRAFAIAGNGNLLPARMAIGYVLACSHLKTSNAGDPANACDFLLASEKKRTAPCTRYAAGSDSESRCEYSAAQGALSDTLDWTKERHIRVIHFESDEEGYFTTITASEPFTLFVSGQGGSQQCIWQQLVHTGTSNIKLSAPTFTD